MKPGDLLYCRRCSTAYASIGEVPAICPQCEQETVWTTLPLQPRRPYFVNENDRRFLKSIKIQPE